MSACKAIEQEFLLFLDEICKYQDHLIYEIFIYI